MSRPEPKYAVGEAVMVRCDLDPHLNLNYTKVVYFLNLRAGDEFEFLGERYGLQRDNILYLVDGNKEMLFLERQLHPIPREKPNGIDALEFIKDLAGVSA